MFNLIIYGDGEMWTESQPWSIDASRFLEYSCDEAKELFKDRRNLTRLVQLPTIVTGEWGRNTSQVVRVGSVKSVKYVGRQIQFTFKEHSHTTVDLLDDCRRELQLHDWEQSRSHWAVKDGDLPQKFVSELIRGTYQEFPYEIVISYASENIEYVDEVAHYLKKAEVSFFYAPFEEPELWGKSLRKELDVIYRNLGRHCLMFVSADYARKVWPTYESKIAMERAMHSAAEQRDDYILACRFDQTEIPGMASDVVYQDLTTKTPKQIAELVISKLRSRRHSAKWS
ncbi:TIR domain-containing protein [Gimesia sp.]|uniref:TIR domain-containing protein n=1 Tax=Gimesia sp. TaxID=2024833 RepID=UPI003A936432